MNTIPPEQLLAEVDELLRTMPTAASFLSSPSEKAVWIGRASAVVHAWDTVTATIKFDQTALRLNSSAPMLVNPAINQTLAFLHQVRHDLCLRTQSPLSVNVATGSVFDYFDEIRKAIETSKQDLFFIDPYLDAEFVSRYLPHVSSGVTVRLLARERMTTLISAVELLRQQASITIQIRSSPGFHDRYFIVDRAYCFQSGASFKDGAKKAPTTLTQILDAFPAVQSTYEALWSSGTVHP